MTLLTLLNWLCVNLLVPRDEIYTNYLELEKKIVRHVKHHNKNLNVSNLGKTRRFEKEN